MGPPGLWGACAGEDGVLKEFYEFHFGVGLVALWETE